MYVETTATKKIIGMKSRVRAVAGGTSASKTISILLYLIAMAQSDKKPTLTTIGAESVPHLKRGAIRDFKNIMQAHNYWKVDRWSKSDKIYEFETGSKIEFIGLDEPDKFRGGRRDRLYINECNNVAFAAYEQLEVRTKEFVYLDWNPSNEFWFYQHLENKDYVEFITLTYKDNEALSPEIVKAIEAKKDNPRWWRVYGLGLLGEAEGRVYQGWQTIDEIPHEARLVRRGMDFGYKNDPTAIVDIYEYNGGYILDEVCYQTGLLNRQIADILLRDKSVMTIADSAEPKSIDDIAERGVLIQPSVKGKDSINAGVNFIQDQKISVTKRSTNVLKEYRNYMYKKKRHEDGFVNVPEDAWNHAMDAIRYGLYGYRSHDEFEDYEENYQSWSSSIGI